MKFKLLAIIFSTISVSLFAQPMEEIDLHDAPTFVSLEDALKAADKVHRLDLSGKKLKELPESIKKLVHLQELKLDQFACFLHLNSLLAYCYGNFLALCPQRAVKKYQAFVAMLNHMLAKGLHTKLK